MAFAIIMSRQAFFPLDALGHRVDKFENLSDVWRNATFASSLLASSWGLTRFVLFGPFATSLKSDQSTRDLMINGITVLLSNLMFSFRLFMIESIFFSYYQSYDSSYKPYKTISALINDDGLRILVYFLPSIIPILINIYRLISTHGNFLKLCFQYPQLILIPGFTPFMYETKIKEAEEDEKILTVKVWKKGTMINAMYSFFIAPIALIASDCTRGSLSWNNTPNETVPYRYTNSVIKHQFGNIGFSVSSIILGLISIVLLSVRFYDYENRRSIFSRGFDEIRNDTVDDSKEKDYHLRGTVKCKMNILTRSTVKL